MRLTAVALVIVAVGGVAGRRAHSQAPPPAAVTQAQYEGWTKVLSNWGRASYLPFDAGVVEGVVACVEQGGAGMAPVRHAPDPPPAGRGELPPAGE